MFTWKKHNNNTANDSKKSDSVAENKPLPIKYVNEIIGVDRLRGRMLGLMAEISKRTDNPITFEDEFLKGDDIFIHAFLRIAKVVTKEEQRVISALIDESNHMSESGLGKDSCRDLVRTIELMRGWETDAMKIFEDGGSMYDLLTFTNPEFLKQEKNSKESYGYRGQIQDDHLKRFESDGKYGLKDDKGTIILESIYDEIGHYGYVGYGWYIRKDGKLGAVNSRGEWMFPIEYEGIRLKFAKGYFLKKNGKWGYLDEKSEFSIDFLYDELEYSYYGGFKAKKDGKWGYMDDGGKVLIPFDYDYVSLSDQKMVLLERNDKYGFYNLNDGSSIPLEYEYAWDFFHFEETKVKKNSRWGVIDCHNNVVLPFEYEQVFIDEIGTYRVRKDDLYGIVNKDGRILFPFKYKDLGKFDEDGITYAANSESKYGYIDKAGNVLIDFMFYSAKNFDGDYAEVSDGRWDKEGVINKKGNIVVPMIYSYIFIHRDGIIEVGNAGRRGSGHFKGLYDLKKNTYLPCEYERIECMHRNREGFMECRCWFSEKDFRDITVGTHIEDHSSETVLPKKRIAVARDFAVVLNDDGRKLELIGWNPEFIQLSHNHNDKFIKLAAGFDGYMALDVNGHLHVGPRSREFETGYILERLQDIVDVVSCEGHTLVLHSNGRVTCVDEPGGWEGPERFKDKVSFWTDIVQVACGYDFVLGLKSDGTLISEGKYYDCPNWKNVKQIDAFNCYYGKCYTIAILSDGSVTSDFNEDVESWCNVKSVSVGNAGYVVGLKSDGTAYAIGNEEFENTVKSWRGIVEIECKFNNAVALLEDGTIVSTFRN